jgi:integrase
VHVLQGRTKTFIVLLGSGRRHTIGRYGAVTLAEARAAAKRLQAEKTLGRVFPQSVPLAEACTLFLSRIERRPNTVVYYARMLNRLKHSKLSEITPRDIHRQLDGANGSTANQTLAVLRAFFKWCVRRQYLDRSPCEGMTLPAKAKSKDRFLTDTELRSVWRAAERQGYPHGTIIKLLIVTGQRRGEIASLRRDFIDTQTRIMTFPASLTKNGSDEEWQRASHALRRHAFSASVCRLRSPSPAHTPAS